MMPVRMAPPGSRDPRSAPDGPPDGCLAVFLCMAPVGRLPATAVACLLDRSRCNVWVRRSMVYCSMALTEGGAWFRPFDHAISNNCTPTRRFYLGKRRIYRPRASRQGRRLTLRADRSAGRADRQGVHQSTGPRDQARSPRATRVSLHHPCAARHGAHTHAHGGRQLRAPVQMGRLACQ